MFVAFLEGMASKVKHLFGGFYIKAVTACYSDNCSQRRSGSNVLFSLAIYLFTKNCKVTEVRLTYAFKLDDFVNILPACFTNS